MAGEAGAFRFVSAPAPTMVVMTDCVRTAAGRGGHFSVGTPRVLVVEDSETIREMVSEALADVGYHTDARCDGDGLEKVLDGMRPDLVVLDVMLPGRDGFALIDVIREWGDIGIVMITARDGLPDRLRGLDGGATTTSSSRSSWPSWCRGSARCCADAGGCRRWFRSAT